MSAKVSPFRDEKYVADKNFIGHYHDQMSFLLAKEYDVDVEDIKPLVKEVFQPATNGFPEIKFQVLEKNKYGDRELKVKTAREFFNEVEDNNYHLSPSFVAYKNSDEEQSVNSIGTDGFLNLRAEKKTERQKAKAAGDNVLYRAFDEIQNALKIFNNAQSGAMSSSGTPLNNKSGHTSLTSTCRSLTSTANIMNEKLLTGNRLFINFEKTIENFLSLLQSTNIKRVIEVANKLNMVHATTDQVMEMVNRCTNYYWTNDKRTEYIREFVDKLRPEERTVLLCVSDINGLYTTNPSLMQSFFDDWCDIPAIPKDAKAEDYPKPSNGDYYVLCVSKLGDSPSKLAINHLHAHHLAVEEKWSDFISVFFKCKIPPSGIFSIKEMIRESVLTSDTDSSIYTVDRTIQKYTQSPEVALRLNGVLTYFIRMVSVHQHAQLSKNMNVSEKNLYRLTMKNEFMFGSYVTTLMSKHYFATQMMVEGVMGKEIEMEIKGVHLRSSKVAAKIKEFAHKLMRDILDAVYESRMLNASTLLGEIADLEREIFKDLEEGSWAWLTRSTIKPEDTYTNPESSIFKYHGLWQEVFAPTYGDAPPIPYSAYKVNTKTLSKQKIAEYLEELGDTDVSRRLAKYLEKEDKLTSFYVPLDMVKNIGGIPKEMIIGSDPRSIIKQNLKSIYAVLDTTGLYFINKKITRLVSDEH